MRFLPGLIIVLMLCSCSSKTLESARSDFMEGQPGKAVELLADCSEVSERDRLLCFMEKGSMYFSLGQYQESSQSFLLAEELMKEQDQISIIDQSSALIISDQTMEYKGEFAERLWVHTYQMLNYILLNDFESAQVEAKQAIEIFEKYPQALRHENFSRALVGLCFENMQNFNSALIEYKKLGTALGEELRLPGPLRGDEFEVVLFISQGRIPIKIAREVVYPPSVRISLPQYSNYLSPPQLSISSEKTDAFLVVATDLGIVAKESLHERVTEYVTRQVARAATKEAMAQAAGQHDAVAEALVRLVLFFAEQADTRSWQTLPSGWTIARIRLKEGSHTVNVYNEYNTLMDQLMIDGTGGTRHYFLLTF